MIVVNKSLREYGGDVAIGAYGIIYRVAMLFLMIVSGLNQGMQPIVGCTITAPGGTTGC